MASLAHHHKAVPSTLHQQSLLNHTAPPQLDEGYSEAPQTRAEDEVGMASDEGYEDHIRNALLSLPKARRLELIKDACLSFSTPELLALHHHVGAMVYFDPVQYLPTELVLNIFSHLPPKDLLTASLVSRPWRARLRDERLWRDCFAREGWVVDRSAMRNLEDLAKEKGADVAETILRDATKRGARLERRTSRKRPRDEAFSETESTAANVGQEDRGLDATDSDDGMEGVEGDWTQIEARREPVSHAQAAVVPATDAAMNAGSPSSSTDSAANFEFVAPPQSDLTEQSPLFTVAKEPKVSWPYLYKQRHRLERNWHLGKYATFRLPKLGHDTEGHQECVYTIQYSGNWLVSGSRDKTIRIWNLTTERLQLPPLKGHEASVLCLQFDESPGPGHDIIVSGGSDSLVIVWRFSTGEMIQKLAPAHKESVLNLRFDHRYLITCSKDKTIMIWNRHEIAKDDPIIPARVVTAFQSLESLTIPAFTVLDTLTGHHAAVNAVQIHGTTIISASGDRTIRAWDIHSGHSKKQYTGHTKGIACVQFDGRRIVSGSSDNSVRIFDYDSQAEIACLEGHNNLVRTVQARFGDLDITTDDELQAESQRADEQFFRALGRGMPTFSRRRRNAGSSRPEDMQSTGTKMPPGGGGSRWAKIVSGSYDETVIIWSRGRDGGWKPKLRLSQPPVLHHGLSPRRHLQNPAANNLQALQAWQLLAAQQPMTNQAQAQNFMLHFNAMLQHGGQPPIAQALQPAPNPTVTTTVNTTTTTTHNHANAQAQGGPGNAFVPTNAPAAQPTAPAAAAAHPAPTNPQNPGGNQPAANANPAAHIAGPGTQHAPGGHAHPPHHHAHHHHHGAPGTRGETNRVFKLQFDARRIIACSQNRNIVGWDFANGEPDLQWIGDWSVETG